MNREGDDKWGNIARYSTNHLRLRIDDGLDEPFFKMKGAEQGSAEVRRAVAICYRR